jgi:hypothetical protein
MAVSSHRDWCVPTFASEHLDSLLGAFEEMIARPKDAYPSRIVSLGGLVRSWVVISDVEVIEIGTIAYHRSRTGRPASSQYLIHLQSSVRTYIELVEELLNTGLVASQKFGCHGGCV